MFLQLPTNTLGVAVEPQGGEVKTGQVPGVWEEVYPEGTHESNMCR